MSKKKAESILPTPARNNPPEVCLSEELEYMQNEWTKSNSDCVQEESDKGYLSNGEDFPDWQVPEDSYREEDYDDYTDMYENEYYDDDEDYTEYPNYGDGVDEETFSNIKRSFLQLISSTYVSGKKCEGAVNFLASVIGVCNLQQRQELMELKEDGHFPLSLVSTFGDLDMVRFFIEHCNADITCENGGLAMIWAVQKQHLEVLDYLMECGGDIGTNIHNSTLLTVALGIYFPESSQKSHFLKLDFGRVNRNISTDTFNYLIQKGVVEKSSDDSLFRCLKYCIDCHHHRCFPYQTNYTECFKLLLDKLDNVDKLRDDNGLSLLGYAIKNKKTKNVELLLEAGANINHVNLVKYISWFDLEMNATEPADNIVDKLFTNLTNKREETIIKDFKSYVHPIKYVAAHGYTDMLICLLKLPEIDLFHKIDAVEVYGATLVLRSKSEDALMCWNACMDVRMGCNLPSVNCITKEFDDKTDLSDTGSICTDEVLQAENDLVENGSDHEEWLDGYQSDSSDISGIGYPLDNHMFFHMLTDKAGSANEIIENLNECFRTPESKLYPKGIVNASRPVFNHVLECQSKQDLQNLDKDYIGLLTQSALIYERVMGYMSRTIMDVFSRIAEHYQKQGHLNQFILALVYALVHLKQYERERKESHISMSRLLQNLMYTILTEKKICTFKVSTIMTVTKMVIVDMARRNLEEVHVYGIHDDMSGLLSLLELINNIEKTSEEYLDFKRLVKTILHLDFRDTYGQSLLHYASLVQNDMSSDRVLQAMNFTNYWNIAMFKGGSLSLTNLLLSYGAEPNVQDNEGRTPLHAIYINMGTSEVCSEVRAIIQDLIEAGGHLDTVDYQCKTPIDYSQSTSAPLCPLKHQNLQCLSSLVILDHKIKYQHDLPLHLIKYIELHKMNGNKENYMFAENKYKMMCIPYM